MTTSRRDVFKLAAGAIAAAATPAPLAIAAEAAATMAPAATRLAWAVGTPGEFDWQHITAGTEDEAIRRYACETVGGDGCEDGGEDDCECEWCLVIGSVEAQRQPAWDQKSETTNADWLRVGMGSFCSRCGYETISEEGGHAVGDEAVCADCMTLADWDIVDPERAAELRTEIAEEEA